MSTTTISVIIPCYNYGHFLGETLQSVETQTLEDWECLIVDDGSTDDTVSVAKKFVHRDARFRLFEVPNGGPSAARNFGLTMASGKYIQFLDADDLLEKRKLELQSRFLEEHPETDLIYGEAATFKLNAGDNSANLAELDFSTYRDLPRVKANGPELIEKLLRNNIMVISAPLVRREFFDNLGRDDFFLPSLVGNEDWELWLRGALRGARYEFHSMSETLTLIRVHPSSWSRTGTRMLETWVQMYQLTALDVENTPFAALNARQLSLAMFSLACAQKDQGAKGAALATLRNMRSQSGSWSFLMTWIGWLVLKYAIVLKLWMALKRLKG